MKLASYIPNQFLTIMLVFGLLLIHDTKVFSQCTTLPQRESVINGDFEGGYIASGPGSFLSDNLYAGAASNATQFNQFNTIISNKLTLNDSTCTSCPCAWSSDGKYWIDSYKKFFKCNAAGPFTTGAGSGFYRGNPFLTEMDGMDDHTKGIGGKGKYLMVDCKNATNSQLWGQNALTVYPNQVYYLSAWFINLTPVSNGAARADLRFQVQWYDASMVPIGGLVALGGSNWSPADASRGSNWEQYVQTTTSPVNAAYVDIEIWNNSGDLIGNDIGIDDISFSNGCQSVTSLNVPPAPNLGTDINICATNGTVSMNSSVTASGGTRTFTWYKDKGTGIDSLITGPSGVQNTYATTRPGTYRVCVYEAPGCAKSDYITISETNAVAMTPTTSICQPNSLTVPINGALTASHASYTYSWRRNGTPVAGTSNAYTAASIGTYQLTSTHPTRSACTVVGSTIINNTNTMTTTIGAGVDLCGTPNQAYSTSLTGSAFTYKWLRTTDTLAGANASSYTATMAGTYRVFLDHPLAGCDVLSNAATVTNTNPSTPNGNTFCAPTAKNVALSVTGTGRYKWMSAASGGTQLGVGSTYTTPLISSTTTYYVQDTTQTSGASMTTNTTLTNGYLPNGGGIVFNVASSARIKNVTVSIPGWNSFSNAVLRVLNNSGTQLWTSGSPTTLSNTSSASTLNYTFSIDYTLPSSGTYRLVMDGSGQILSNGSPSYPFTDGGANFTVTGSAPSYSTSSTFKNLTFDIYSNPCARLPVTALHSGLCVTPVEFAFIEAEKTDNGNQITWATANEEDASHFVILRSTDNKNYTSVGTLKAAGNSSQLINYSFVDNNVLDGITYYKLAQYDFDGDINYSSIVSVNNVGLQNIIIAPNPFSNSTKISLVGFEGATVTIKNAIGRSIEFIEEVRNNQLEIGNNYPSGIYIIEISNQSGTKTFKVIKE